MCQMNDRQDIASKLYKVKESRHSIHPFLNLNYTTVVLPYGNTFDRNVFLL